MTRMITVEIPDDLAEYFDAHPERVQSVVSAAQVAVLLGEETRIALAAAGFIFSEEGLAKWREKLRPRTEVEAAKWRRRALEVRADREARRQRLPKEFRDDG
jgi:hypothetical protein